MLEKNAHVGGNSAKASSGINAVNGAAGDSAAVFAGDTLRSGGGLSDAKLVEVLAVSGWGRPASRECRRRGGPQPVTAPLATRAASSIAQQCGGWRQPLRRCSHAF